MSKVEKLREKVLAGDTDVNINFNDLCWLLQKYKFDKRIKGSHHIFTKSGIEEILNLQPKGSKAKSYQVNQVRDVILKYRIGDNDE